MIWNFFETFRILNIRTTIIEFDIDTYDSIIDSITAICLDNKHPEKCSLNILVVSSIMFVIEGEFKFKIHQTLKTNIEFSFP